jgi:hypothetical protein
MAGYQRLAVRSFDGMRIMTSNVTGQTETENLGLEVSDEALERAATLANGQRAVTFGICTDWYTCGWPLSPVERSAAPHRT